MIYIFCLMKFEVIRLIQKTLNGMLLVGQKSHQ